MEFAALLTALLLAALVVEPLEVLEKLAVLVPRPRVNLVLYNGLLARTRGRARRPWKPRPASHSAPGW